MDTWIHVPTRRWPVSAAPSIYLNSGPSLPCPPLLLLATPCTAASSHEAPPSTPARLAYCRLRVTRPDDPQSNQTCGRAPAAPAAPATTSINVIASCGHQQTNARGAILSGHPPRAWLPHCFIRTCGLQLPTTPPIPRYRRIPASMRPAPCLASQARHLRSAPATTAGQHTPCQRQYLARRSRHNHQRMMNRLRTWRLW